MAAPTIALHDVTLGYDGHPAVHHLSGRIAAGTLLAVVGPNGAGKSTLIKALAGLLRPIGGRIDGLAGQRVAYLPQQASLESGFPILVGEFAAMGLWHETGAFGGFSAAQRERVRAALAAVGLQGHARQPLDTLSGGQLQRTLFARMMLQDADVLLLDEPFSAIDQRTTADLLQLLRHWHAAGKTVLAVLHDLHQVRDAFPETLMLAREPVGWGPTDAVLTPANLQRLRAMPEAFDDRAPVCEAAPPATNVPQAQGHAQGHAHGNAHDHVHGHAHAAAAHPSSTNAGQAKPLPQGPREPRP
ncbi:ABC transporter ATP-binding protein [Ottowia sp.]|uniref:metal ABC transporter ATP-binding protein n=1 Tax=Ottowia sp. TaxID=1898956 RepID=UPI002BEE21BC|nr:ABC transporter ATP-binding protein [Ottowia sp.]HOB65177.1 ABC transporter ATP-binding protein [Ottowia sp.]HPZ57458.1 ABC transporter ATP-binding protein [Ottowia sp.]HQD47702.1 ABC transporter ATP-binding protein [Ottowia sp.]